MNIQKIQIDKIKPYHLNCKIHNKKNIEAIKYSIQKFDQYKPLVINNNSEIIIGNGTYIALKELNYKQVDVIFLDLTEQEEIILNIADNKTSELSTWNENLIEKLQTFDSELLNILDFDEKFLKKFKKIEKKSEKSFDFSKQQNILNTDNKILVQKQTFIKCPYCGREFLKK